jgi:lysophospholipase L1-like esterase
MAPPPPPREAASLGNLLLAAGAVLALLALAADPGLVARFHFRRPLSSEALAETARTRAILGAAALALALGGGWLRFGRRARPPSPWAIRGVLAAGALLLPMLVLERGARPFVERLTTLFQVDPLLGWRNRPGAADTFWGEPARINAQGLRGTERARPKPAGARRVLVLGDSVAFGLLLTDDAVTFPAALERALGEAGAPAECLNAGVAGWSTRQQRLYLAREGEGWQPDLVLVLFVLNDVTERTSGAATLAYTRPPHLPAWLAESGIYLALHELALRRSLRGDSPAARAHRERLTPYHLLLQSDSPPVREAWQGWWPEIEGIRRWCEERALPLVLAAFPYALQVRDEGLDAPQRLLADYAARRGLAYLDLLPPLAQPLRNGACVLDDLFLDGVHPSARGVELAARSTARFLRERGLAR